MQKQSAARYHATRGGREMVMQAGGVLPPELCMTDQALLFKPCQGRACTEYEMVIEQLVGVPHPNSPCRNRAPRIRRSLIRPSLAGVRNCYSFELAPTRRCRVAVVRNGDGAASRSRTGILSMARSHNTIIR